MQGGIYNPPVCGTLYLVDHAVLLVGYNTNESSWTLKNSWGTRYLPSQIYMLSVVLY